MKAETMSFVIVFCVAGCMIPNLVISTNQSAVSFAMKVLSKWNKFGKQMFRSSSASCISASSSAGLLRTSLNGQPLVSLGLSQE